MCEYDEDLEEFDYAEEMEDRHPDLDPEESEYVDYMMATGEGPLGDGSGCQTTYYGNGMRAHEAAARHATSSGFGWFVSWISFVVILDLCNSASLNSVL